MCIFFDLPGIRLRDYASLICAKVRLASQIRLIRKVLSQIRSTRKAVIGLRLKVGQSLRLRLKRQLRLKVGERLRISSRIGLKGRNSRLQSRNSSRIGLKSRISSRFLLQHLLGKLAVTRIKRRNVEKRSRINWRNWQSRRIAKLVKCANVVWRPSGRSKRRASANRLFFGFDWLEY